MSEEIIDSLDIYDAEKNEIKNLLITRGQLKSQISHKESMAEALSGSRIKEVKHAVALLDDHDKYLENYRGKEFIGLPQKRIRTLDKLTLGLRGLMLLAAAPNVGKTALTLQLGLDVLIHNEDACIIYISLEMRREVLMSRIRCHLSELDWHTLTFGSTRKAGAENLFKEDDWGRLQKGNEKLKAIGNRLFLITEKDIPSMTPDSLLHLVNHLKAKSGSSRVFVIVDYLQVIPIPESVRSIRSELGEDKWRIGLLKSLSESLGDDPVFTISEARKPDKGSPWGSSLSDIMGSARGSYTPDAVFLYRSLLEREAIKDLCGKDLTESDFEKIKKIYEEKQYDLQQLQLPKARDGMKKGTVYLKFFYNKNIFEETSLHEIKEELLKVVKG